MALCWQELQEAARENAWSHVAARVDEHGIEARRLFEFVWFDPERGDSDRHKAFLSFRTYLRRADDQACVARTFELMSREVRHVEAQALLLAQSTNSPTALPFSVLPVETRFCWLARRTYQTIRGLPGWSSLYSGHRRTTILTQSGDQLTLNTCTDEAWKKLGRGSSEGGIRIDLHSDEGADEVGTTNDLALSRALERVLVDLGVDAGEVTWSAADVPRGWIVE